MSNSEDDANAANWAEFEKHSTRFFALIGHCITKYQTLEDYLSDVFAAALGINEAKALKIFNHVRGLETKLAMISEALNDATEEHQLRWQTLLVRVRAAADARNQIAHANPVHHAGPIVIVVDDDLQVKSAKRTGSDRMELRKRASNAVWTTELLIAEHERASRLFGHLIAFVMRFKGQTVPEHLEEPFEPASPKGKEAKPRRRGKKG